MGKKIAIARKIHSAKKYLSNMWLVLKEFLFIALKYCAVKGSYEIPLIFFYLEITSCLRRCF